MWWARGESDIPALFVRIHCEQKIIQVILWAWSESQLTLGMFVQTHSNMYLEDDSFLAEPKLHQPTRYISVCCIPCPFEVWIPICLQITHLCARIQALMPLSRLSSAASKHVKQKGTFIKYAERATAYRLAWTWTYFFVYNMFAITNHSISAIQRARGGALSTSLQH